MTVSSTFDERRLLVADLAGTLIGGSKKGRRKLQEALEAIRSLLTLVYVSGRTLSEQLEAIDNNQLLMPDYIVSSVGTEIHRMPGEHPLDDWYAYIQTGFNREEIIGYMQEQYPNLELQPAENQTPLKVSYYLEQADREQLDKLEQRLVEEGFPAKVIYSHKLFLDIIPERAGLGAAVKFLVDSLALFPNQVFVSGDSGKDIDLFQYGYRGIVVGNAARELKKAVEMRAYFSHEEHAEGLLEGLRHYNFFATATKPVPQDLAREAYERAFESLRRNMTPAGFSAASLEDNPLTDSDSNYFSVWSRDGIKSGLWSLCLNDAEVTQCFRRTLELMAEHQTDSGQIPAYVQIETGRPEYSGIGGIASIDSVLWFVIGGSRYGAYTGDRDFLESFYPHLDLAMHWLRAHDSNNCGLLEVPESSDWMDLFPRNYNVLYDEVLWYLACRDFSQVSAMLDKDPQGYDELHEIVRKKILRQFWPTAKQLSDTKESFSERQFTLGDAQYLLAEISPFDFSWRCDVYANLLGALVGLLDEQKLDQLFHFLWGVGVNSPYPVVTFYPAIQSGASDWKDYFITNFLNLPHHYHNGGIWLFVGGLWVRFLQRCGRVELAHRELNALAEACRLGLYGEWEFNEWLHGLTGRPMGKAHQAWSAASYIAAYRALHHDMIPPDFESLEDDIFEIASTPLE